MKKDKLTAKRRLKRSQDILKRRRCQKEDTMLNDLGGEKSQCHVFFLMTLSGLFTRISESSNFHALWAENPAALETAKKTIDIISEKLQQKNQPVSMKEIALWTGMKTPMLESFIEVSKNIQKNQEGLYGLKQWPEINPKGIKDKIYLLFKKAQKPFHFTEVAEHIEGSLVQTVHNELIRRPAVCADWAWYLCVERMGISGRRCKGCHCKHFSGRRTSR